MTGAIKKAAVFSVALWLAGCASVSDYHGACMDAYKTIASQLSCIKANLAQDPAMQDDMLVQEYLQTGDLLSRQVQSGKLSEQEAQLRFIEKLNEIRARELQEQAYRAQIDRLYQMSFPRETICVPTGKGGTRCTTY